MACSPSPVASSAWHDISGRYGNRVGYLGIVGDASHQTRVSGHNCGALQESALRHPVTEVLVAYPDGYAHALDTDVFADHDLAAEIIRYLLADPYYRVRYCLHNGRGYYPAWRGGGTFPSTDHEHHVHTSFTPWATYDVRPFRLGAPKVLTPEAKAAIIAQASAAAARRPFLYLRPGHPFMGEADTQQDRRLRRLVTQWQQLLGLANVDGIYGPGTMRATRNLQQRFDLYPAGSKELGAVTRRTWELAIFFGLLRYYGFA